MKRSEFRSYFEADPVHSFAFFDRSGNARVGLPYPTSKKAELLVGYKTVIEVDLGFHRFTSRTEPFKTMLTGWGKTLKKLEIQDFRYERSKKIDVIHASRSSLLNLTSLYEVSLTNIQVQNESLQNLARLRRLRNVWLSGMDLCRQSLKILAKSTSIKEVWILNCPGVEQRDEEILVNAGLNPRNVRINR